MDAAASPPPAKRQRLGQASRKTALEEAGVGEPQDGAPLPVDPQVVVDRVLALLKGFADQAMNDVDMDEAGKERRMLTSLAERLSKRLLERGGHTSRLGTHHIDDYLLTDLDDIAEARQAQLDQIPDIEQRQLQLEEELKNLKEEVQTSKEDREAGDIAWEAAHADEIDPLALEAYPLDGAEELLPTVFTPWEDPFLNKLARSLMPALLDEDSDPADGEADPNAEDSAAGSDDADEQ